MATSAVASTAVTLRSYSSVGHFIRAAALVCGIFAGNKQFKAVKAERDERWKKQVAMRDEKIEELEKKLNPPKAVAKVEEAPVA
mmetsp:Transcript_18970/g.76133  ORF Transcript_18970/g.76133 Transcript_18970/m.76133 type:complete len:84 (+) Transcript_18970:257-508(+)|eukprot:CAMPEP_0113953752 /NCGR_PEP_ID=MMETSP0011_2-20120614/18_1 /TAXON_ID=101924 /ORGANISM="Rhodosorus marinus" /LENGTH=83 /DNA_ID=CAMNT_0000962497 /DNA_START=204 /DNA_END=455 /DNA_ORIENTATION=+ /assembly_acc=CAM_ASM_000156